MMNAFQKIFTTGSKYTTNIFKEDVVIAEKVDGSQFCFGKDIDGKLCLRSKGSELTDNRDGLFKKAVIYVHSIVDRIPYGTTFYCEYLNKPKHNVLKYNRIPKNNLILFGIRDLSAEFFHFNQSYKETMAKFIGIECVPTLFKGKIKSIEAINKYLEIESCLGGVKVEGIVIENYNRKSFYGGNHYTSMLGKLVSERFKEIHGQPKIKPIQSLDVKIEDFFKNYKTDARWEKAVQYLRDSGKFGNDLTDIGNIFKRVHQSSSRFRG